MLQRRLALRVHRVAQHVAKALRQIFAHRARLFVVFGARGDAHHHLAVFGVQRGRGVVALQERRHAALEVAFAHAGHAQGNGVQRPLAQRGQPRAHLLEEHRAHLARRPRQQHGPAAGLFCVLKDHAGRGAVVVSQRAPAHGHIGLLFVVLRRGAPARGEKALDVRLHALVVAQFVPKRARDGLLCHVVVRGAEAPGEHQQIAARHGRAHGGLQARGVVAHDGLIIHVDAQGRQLAREELRVRVDDVPSRSSVPTAMISAINGCAPFSQRQTARHRMIFTHSAFSKASCSSAASCGAPASAASTSASVGFVLGCGGVKMVQQSS